MSANRDVRRVPPTAHIAVIGAGVAGLTAAHTLMRLGYPHVTVYEKADMPGGKVLTNYSMSLPVELGGLFATEGYAVTLELARELGVETYPWHPQIAILDEDGQVLSRPEFALRKYGPERLMGGLRSVTRGCPASTGSVTGAASPGCRPN